MFQRTVLAVAGVLLALVMPTTSFGAVVVVPPDQTVAGETYGEWSAEWWQWAFSLPVDQHPLFDTADCSEGQSGPVWFLGGTFVATDLGSGVFLGQADRTCTIPANKA